jgi:hypothetical protein
MPMAQNEFISKFPGIRRVSEANGNITSLYFLEYQSEQQMIGSIKDTWNLLLRPEPCHAVIVKTGEYWDDAHRYYKSSEVIASLFDCSLSKYVTKVGIEGYWAGHFNLWLKFKDIEPGKVSNVGPDFIEYVTSMMSV